MLNYIIRRILYAIPILIGVNLLTFALFFVVNTPDNMARIHLGVKHVTPEAIAKWKRERSYDKPLLWNSAAEGVKKLSDTILVEKSARMFVFDFGRSDEGRDIAHDIRTRMWPSLVIALPVFVVGLAVNITFAMLMAFFRATYIDVAGVVLCVAMMSISGLFYIIGGQYLVSKLLHLTPISGYDAGLNSLKFIILPVIIGVIGGIGSGARWYRTIFLEEATRDYVRTARAKGLSELRVLFGHVLKNAMIPILTGVVVVIPLLFMGSLITESFFGIPGLGSYTIGLILTDISYTLVDPRIRLE
jgi:peptide/nickel transport system permease protein